MMSFLAPVVALALLIILVIRTRQDHEMPTPSVGEMCKSAWGKVRRKKETKGGGDDSPAKKKEKKEKKRGEGFMDGRWHYTIVFVLWTLIFQEGWALTGMKAMNWYFAFMVAIFFYDLWNKKTAPGSWAKFALLLLFCLAIDVHYQGDLVAAWKANTIEALRDWTEAYPLALLGKLLEFLQPKWD